MAKITNEDILNAISEMTILEVNELVEGMKEKFGVDPSAVAVAAPAAGAAVEEGPSTADVVLASAGSNKLAVIKLIKEITGLGLKEAKEKKIEPVDTYSLQEDKASSDEANELKAKFEEAGATVELK